MDLRKFIIHTIPFCSLSKIVKKILDQKRNTGVIFVDFSTAFGCLNQDILLTKLEAYGFTIQALKFIQNYLCNRKQRAIVNGSYSL